MPIYQYKCDCAEEPDQNPIFEYERKITDAEPLYICPECDIPMTRVYGVPGILFNGSGFYATDNRKA
jgi:putative FmdB family regulatory protein